MVVLVAVESDGDLRTALTSFADVAAGCLPVKYRTFHVRECMEVLLQRDDRVELLKPQLPSKKRLASSPHLQEHHHRLHPRQLIDPLEGVQDIRSSFRPS